MTASPIVGPAYRARSRNISDQRCVNLYLEIIETKTGKEPAYLSACPGLVYQADIGIGPIRGLHTVGNTLYVASGSSLYAVAPGFVPTQIGQMLTTSGKVSIIDNGVQVAFSDRVQLYVWAAGMLTQPLNGGQLPPGDLVYQDTLGFFNQLGTFNLWQSNANDLTTWNALNFTTVDGSQQPIVALTDLHRQVVPMKGNSAEFWINAGLPSSGIPGFVLQRLDGVFPQIGAVNASSVVNAGEEICWLGADDGGHGVFYAMGGYEPRRISTYDQEYTISQYRTISDCIGWSYIQAGHRFVVWNFPTADQTWVYDMTVSAQLGYPCWHERASFYNGQFHVYEPNCAALFSGAIIVGSNQTGNLYELDLTSVSDGAIPSPPELIE